MPDLSAPLKLGADRFGQVTTRSEDSLDIGANQGERRRWPREALPILRGMLDPERPSSSGPHCEDLLELLAADADLSYRHIIVGLLAPYDEEAITRIVTEVRPRLEAMLTA